MFHRRGLLGAFALAFAWSLAGAPGASAATPFTTSALDKAKASGAPVLVEITAPWCPTCKAQKPILSELLSQPAFKDMVVLTVDFDSQKDAVRALGAQSQSTLIVFKGTTEKGRSVGDTSKPSIKALLEKAL